MSKTVLIEYCEENYSEEFEVGSFIALPYPHDTPKHVVPARPSMEQLLTWFNDWAKKGLVYHGECGGQFIFRVDGIAVQQLKNELELTSKTRSEYVGCNGTGDMYRDQTTLLMYIDGELISEVSLP